MLFTVITISNDDICVYINPFVENIQSLASIGILYVHFLIQNPKPHLNYTRNGARHSV